MFKANNFVYQEKSNEDGGGGGGGDNQDTNTNDDANTVADMLNDKGVNNNDTGDRPEWLLDKYATEGKSISDATNEQAKGYKELAGKFGNFTGAPENYEVKISEELSEQGVKLADDDPMLVDAMKFAKESNMSQEGFAGLVNLYATQQLAEHKADEEFKQEQIKSLGPGAESRIKNINQWAGKNLDAETVTSLENMASNPEAVKAIERLISMTRSAPVDVDESTNSSGATKEDVAAMQFEKDENGQRRINTDQEFNARYKKLRNEVYGTEEHMQMIG